jgi:hypothetical protein
VSPEPERKSEILYVGFDVKVFHACATSIEALRQRLQTVLEKSLLDRPETDLEVKVTEHTQAACADCDHERIEIPPRPNQP